MNSRVHFFRVSIFVFIICLAGRLSAQTTIIDYQSQWRYFKGFTEASNPIDAWRAPGFDDANWSLGNAPFRYGDGVDGTTFDDMLDTYGSVFLRQEFEVLDNVDIDSYVFNCDYDDGFILWINGVYVTSVNAPSVATYDAFALTWREYTDGQYIDTISASDAKIEAGTNVIAIQLFNSSLTSSDIYFDLKVTQIKALPYSEPITFDYPSDYYSAPFTLTLSTPTVGATIRYTLDASDPRTSATAMTGQSPIQIQVDPASTAGGRGQTPGFVVRAVHAVSDHRLKPYTRSYLFMDEAIAQGYYPGGQWPEPPEQDDAAFHYEMDKDITESGTYGHLIDDALLSIPTFSLVTDNDVLFDPDNGLYVNAEERGDEWRGQASLELLQFRGREGFESMVGITMRGGYSARKVIPKHSFHFAYKSEFDGPSLLEYDLFESEGPSKFDKFDLRTAQNYGWQDTWYDEYNTFARDLFCRTTQGDMGELYTRSRYYHLYLNGEYWGLFMSQEKVSSYFGKTYLGGDKEDYDVLKADRAANMDLTANDGDVTEWYALYDKLQAGVDDNADYFDLFGKNPEGERIDSMKKWLDLSSLITYNLITFYSGDFDAPVSKFLGNELANNVFCVYKKNGKKGWRFLTYDAEHTLQVDEFGGISDGLQENRMNIIGDIDQSSAAQMTPFHIHYWLMDNAEYRMSFAQHVYKRFFNGGELTPEVCRARWNAITQQIDTAIIAESARWGGYKRNNPMTKADWQWAIDQVEFDYFPYRTDIVVQQLIDQGWYPDLEPADLSDNNGNVTAETVQITSDYDLTLENPNNSGTIYYTLDGSDPRAIGGAVNETATALQGGQGTLDITSTTVVKVRVRSGNEWSVMREVVILRMGDYQDLKLTEIMYNPLETDTIVGGKQLEFIELKNVGDDPIDLTGVRITEGIDFDFQPGDVIQPGSFIVLASNDTAFFDRYNFWPFGEYGKSLNNGGEDIVISYSNTDTIIRVNYSDSLPWPMGADGDGPSIVPVDLNPSGDQNDPATWRVSHFEYGSPGEDDLFLTVGSTEPHPVFEVNAYPNPATDNVVLAIQSTVDNEFNVDIIDQMGRRLYGAEDQVYAGMRYTKTIDLEVLDLSTGIYLVRVNGVNWQKDIKIMHLD